MPLVRRSLLLGLCATLGACGFRPMLLASGDVDDPEVRDRLAAVEITGLNGRLGQLVRRALLEELNPTALQVPQRYLLAIRLRRSSSALAVQLDNTITRYNLTLTARFELVDRETSAPLYRSLVRRIASYNVRRAPYSTLTAEIDAERRAAKELGNNIRTLLAVYFAREAVAEEQA